MADPFGRRRSAGTVLMASLFGMALGGWMSGKAFDVTGSCHAAFINGIGWNLLNLSIVLLPRGAHACAPGASRPAARWPACLRRRR
jgi:hypothetical protein